MRALAVSMVGHGVLVASLTWVDRAPQAPEVEDAPIEVELITESRQPTISPQPSALSPQPSSVGSPPASAAPSAVSRPPSAVSRPPSAVSRPPPAGPGMLAMRTSTSTSTGTTTAPREPRTVNLVVPLPADLGPDVIPPPPPPADSVIADDFMRPNGAGTYRYERPGFKADVARDGSVTFEDDPTIDVGWDLPCLECIGEDYAKWKRDPYGGHTVSLLGLLPVLRASFDVTDWLERLAGNDPYSYEKHKFLEATRERRAQMSAAEKRDATRAALLELPKLLASIWDYTEWPAAERRRVLFQLWDECAESGAGVTARATILAFIRRAVDDPYTDDELAELNAERTSTEEFAPYTNAEPRE